MGLRLLLVAIGTAGLVWAAMSRGASKPQPTLADSIKDYRSWKKVNPKPVHMAPQIAVLCRGPLPWEGSANPHNPKYFTVFVNRTGEKAMAARGAAFPAGSIIVKEKLGSADAKSPELLTVMVKKDPGYDPQHGDWQYFTASGDASKTSETDTDKCKSCHVNAKQSDYVFKTYSLFVPVKVGR